MHLQTLIDRRDQLLAEMEALRNKIAGLEIAITLLRNEEPTKGADTGAKKVSTTDTLLALLRESGSAGLNAQTAVEMATRVGLTLNRASVSSLLSRLKRDGTVIYENTRYKLKEHARRVERSSISVGPTADEEARRHH